MLKTLIDAVMNASPVNELVLDEVENLKCKMLVPL